MHPDLMKIFHLPILPWIPGSYPLVIYIVSIRVMIYPQKILPWILPSLQSQDLFYSIVYYPASPALFPRILLPRSSSSALCWYSPYDQGMHPLVDPAPLFPECSAGKLAQIWCNMYAQPVIFPATHLIYTLALVAILYLTTEFFLTLTNILQTS